MLGDAARADGEAVGTGDAFGIEQRLDDDGTGIVSRAPEPEGDEARELLALRLGGVDGKPARRKPVELVSGDGAEIACPLEHAELVPHIGAVDRLAQAEAGKCQVGIVLGPLDRGTEGEQVGPVVDLALRVRLDHVDLDRLLVEEARVQNVETEWRLAFAPEGFCRVEADVAILVVGEVRQFGGKFDPCVHIGLGRQGAGAADDEILGKRGRGTVQRRIVRQRGAGSARQRRKRKEGGARKGAHNVSARGVHGLKKCRLDPANLSRLSIGRP